MANTKLKLLFVIVVDHLGNQLWYITVYKLNMQLLFMYHCRTVCTLPKAEWLEPLTKCTNSMYITPTGYITLAMDLLITCPDVFTTILVSWSEHSRCTCIYKNRWNPWSFSHYLSYLHKAYRTRLCIRGIGRWVHSCELVLHID